MKRVILCLMACISMAIALAEPVAPGYWRVITLRDGSKMQVEYRGDEWATYWGDQLGYAYVENEQGTWDRVSIEEATRDQLAFFLEQDPSGASIPTRRQNIRRANGLGIRSDKSIFQGKKQCLVILVEYQDVAFSDTYKDYGCNDVNSLYKRILNEKDFKDEPFHGSVRDYFLAQSRGQFELNFDVAGPYKLSQKRAYYGGAVYSKNGSSYTHVFRDAHVGAMVTEAIQSAEKDGVDFSKYDWDGDGEVEEVFVIYAGQSQTDNGPTECVYNHKYTLTERQTYDNYYMNKQGLYYYSDVEGKYYTFTFKSCSKLKYDGKTIDTYACAQELATRRFKDADGNYYYDGTQIKGIGSITHEFSHCLGYPDFYIGASDRGYYALGKWDVMNSGTYQGSWKGLAAGYCPPGYSAFERWCAGWIEPVVLNAPTRITNLKPLSGTTTDPDGGGDAYVVYCKGSNIEGEYYLLENRQWTNWDECLPWHGLLISHYDFNASAWSSNKTNSTDHERAGIVQASGVDLNKRLEMDAYPFDPEDLPARFPSGTYGTTAQEIIAALNAAYGTSNLTINTSLNDALTTSTTPSATYYNGGNTKLPFADHEITGIEENKDADRTVNFVYRWPAAQQANLTLALDEQTATAQDFSAGLYASVTLNREFAASNYGNWSTMWLPFAMGRKDLIRTFGENVSVARFTGVTESGNTRTVHFQTTTNGTEAFEPFLIKLSADDAVTGPFTFTQMAVEVSSTTPSLEKEGATFVGTTVKGDIPTGMMFINNNKFYRSVGKSTSRAYRGYFSLAGATGSTSELELPQQEGIGGYTEETRPLDDSEWGYGIHAITVDGVKTVLSAQTGASAVYDMQGRRLSEGSLPKGIYIRNGRKVIIK